jgi:hypothetical protein
MSMREKLPTPLIKAYTRIDYPEVLEQGDIIRYCPDAKPIIIDVNNKSVYFDFNEFNAVVLSQSCDIDKDKIERVLLCPIWKVNDYFRHLRARYESDLEYRAKYASDDDFVNKMKSLLGNIYTGKVNGLQLLKENVEDSGLEPYIVDFGNIYSLPCNTIKSTVLPDPRNSERIRLIPEFRIDLQAKFFAFLARGALPDGSEPVKTEIDPTIYAGLNLTPVKKKKN